MRRILVLLVLALLALAAGFGLFLQAALAEPEMPPRPTEAIAVLTGGAERVETGLRLLEAGLARRLLVSGAAAGTTLPAFARVQRRDPATLEGRVTLGVAAATTRGNAAEVAAFARAHEIRSVRVVTAGYHMPRAMLELRRALPGVELVPHPVRPAALRGTEAIGRLRSWTLLLGEYFKYLLAAAGVSRLMPAWEAAPGR